jgi:hypothetical protein
MEPVGEHHGGNSRPGILQGKVQVAGTGTFAVGNLPLYNKGAEIPFKAAAYEFGKFRNGELAGGIHENSIANEE